jgi:YD repeat-containing protein
LRRLVLDRTGQLTGLTYGNGVQAAWTYRADNSRLERIQVGSTLLDMRYTYDPVGNVRTITDTSNSGQGITFTYDALDRLTRGYTSCGGQGAYDQSFSYNATGNLTSLAGASQWYSDTAHVHAATHLSGTQALWYDANGNTITRTVAGVTQRLAWDAENRLASIVANGVTTTFTYDGDGNRVKVNTNGVITAYVGSTYEVNPGTGVTTTYYYARSQRVAMRTAAGVTWLSGDHLGSALLPFPPREGAGG